jgi:hypothetical protein
MADVVYVLQHHRDGDEDVKMVGVYRSQGEAEAAILRLRGLPGFRDHPAGFETDAYVLNEDHWTEGFGG